MIINSYQKKLQKKKNIDCIFRYHDKSKCLSNLNPTHRVYAVEVEFIFHEIQDFLRTTNRLKFTRHVVNIFQRREDLTKTNVNGKRL